ncbi:MAG: DUF1015 domain-containing protein [Lachnospiraceae bacterium]|nr:DUF1015 domain-containing protein [Lachnospiraceae bacterium]
MNINFEGMGFAPADILLPKDVDMTKWSVVACDQYTSEPEYWEEVENIVGDAPSALRLILPEARLGKPGVEDDIAAINATMTEYLEKDLFTLYPNALIYIERGQSNGRIRHGLIGKLDLESYDFTPGSGALTRATEGTVLERIPPRVKVRRDAPIELPHIMVLIDDDEKLMIEPLAKETDRMQCVYDFELMQGGGHLKGWLLNTGQVERMAVGLRHLASAPVQERKYGLKDAAPLLFAMGDGNHSLATAKQCYEDLKAAHPGEDLSDHPARFALVELVNNHDDALEFEPIHRVLFGVDPEEILAALKAYYPGAYEGEGEGHVLRYVYAGKEGAVTVPHPAMQLEVGTLQSFLDAYKKDHPFEIDYIHGDDTTKRLGCGENAMGFLLPAMGKEQLFKTVMADGVLPRKTFSMGHAQDKRFYTEARKIK